MSKELKVGQIVRILDGRNIHSDYMLWDAGMNEYIGKEATILFNYHAWVDLDTDGQEFGWDEKWLEVVDEQHLEQH